MEEELNMHLELQVRKYTRAGIDADRARVLARRDFGSLENAREQCRDERRVAGLPTWAATLSMRRALSGAIPDSARWPPSCWRWG